jgi:hypothetical protein
MQKLKKHIRMINTASIDTMIEALRERFPDQENDTAVIRYAVRYLFDNEVKGPAYIEVQRKRLEMNSPEEKVKRQVDMKVLKEEYKEEVAIDKGKRMCELLGGTLDDKDMCTYSTYMFINKSNIQKGSITLPVEQLTEKDVEGQYKKFDGTNISKEEFESYGI